MKGLRDLVQQVQLFCGLQVAVADLLEDHEKRIKVLEDWADKQRKLHDGLNTRVIQNEMTLGEHKRHHPGPTS